MTAFTSIIAANSLESILSNENLIIIDCRFSLNDTEEGRNAYHISHLPNAHYAHLDEDLSGTIIAGKTGRHPLPTVEQLSQLCSKWGISSDTQVVAYDAKGGAIAARLWWMLRWLGHDKVAVLEGGWQHWLQNGYPTDSAIPTLSDTISFVPHVRENWIVDATYLVDNLDNSDLLIVDSRGAARYRGEHEPIDPVAGHIPNAVSAPFAENFTANKLMKSEKALKEKFDNLLQEKKAEQAIFYCGSGVTACHNLLAMHHVGLGNGKLYAGSWSDWIVDINRPYIVE